jgi:hypothetical protein
MYCRSKVINQNSNNSSRRRYYGNKLKELDKQWKERFLLPGNEEKFIKFVKKLLRDLI